MIYHNFWCYLTPWLCNGQFFFFFLGMGGFILFAIKHGSPAHFSRRIRYIVGDSVCFGNIFYLKRFRHSGWFGWRLFEQYTEYFLSLVSRNIGHHTRFKGTCYMLEIPMACRDLGFGQRQESQLDRPNVCFWLKCLQMRSIMPPQKIEKLLLGDMNRCVLSNIFAYVILFAARFESAC